MSFTLICSKVAAITLLISASIFGIGKFGFNLHQHLTTKDTDIDKYFEQYPKEEAVEDKAIQEPVQPVDAPEDASTNTEPEEIKNLEEEVGEVNTEEIKEINNFFLARIKNPKTQDNLSKLSCKLGRGHPKPCKVYTLPSTQLTNNISEIYKDSLIELGNYKEDLTDLRYVVVEYNNKSINYNSLKNKTLTLFTESKSEEIGTLEYDQELSKDIEISLEILKAKNAIYETYLVSANIHKSLLGNYGCKLEGNIKNKVLDNIDDSCRLIKIPTPIDKEITPLKAVKLANLTATYDELNVGITEFYKLQVNKHLLYNLNFKKQFSIDTPLYIKLIYQGDHITEYGSLELHQQWAKDGLIGENEWLIVKYLGNTLNIDLKINNTLCSFNKLLVLNKDKNFQCLIYNTNPTSIAKYNQLKNLLVNNSHNKDRLRLIANRFYVMRLPNRRLLEELDLDKHIYLYTHSNTSNSNVYRQYTFKISALISGFIDVEHPKMFYITDMVNPTKDDKGFY